MKSFGARSTFLLDGFPTIHGNVLQVAQEARGWLRFALSYLLICEDVLSGEVILW